MKKLLMAQAHWLISCALLLWAGGIAAAAYFIIDRLVLARWEGQDMAAVLTGLVLLAAVRLGYGPAHSALEHIIYQEVLLRVIQRIGLMTPWARYRNATGHSIHSLKENDEVVDSLKAIAGHLDKLVGQSEFRSHRKLLDKAIEQAAEIDNAEDK